MVKLQITRGLTIAFVWSHWEELRARYILDYLSQIMIITPLPHQHTLLVQLRGKKRKMQFWGTHELECIVEVMDKDEI